MKKFTLAVLFIFTCILLQGQAVSKHNIEYIDLIHICHTDYGFTDNPMIAEELHRKFLDIGIDAVLKSVRDKSKPSFYWTAEVLETVDTWWEKATPQRRNDLMEAIKSGQLEIAAMPFNVHPFYNERLIDKLMNWTSDDLWKQFNPQVAIQHDVNGFPRAAVNGLIDKGVKYFWSGLNLHWGGIFHEPPYAFWWEQPNGQKVLVWLGMPYWEGYLFFDKAEWRYAQRPASNTQFRTPRPGDMLKTDEASVRKAHKVCVERLNKMTEDGYPYDFIAMSMTNQYRCDNDGPYLGLAAFVAKWNELGLQPRINFTTATQAMKRIEAKVGNKIETHKGEWPDWWSFGVAASPRELSASRQASLFVEAAKSPVWGPYPENMDKKLDQIDRDLCRYYEHTFGSWETNRDPFSLFNQAHLNTTYGFAWRPYENSQWLLAQRVRSRLSNEAEGLYAVNTGGTEYTGWIDIDPAAFVRVLYKSVIDTQTEQKQPLLFHKNKGKLWVNNMKPDKIYKYIFSTEEIKAGTPQSKPNIGTDGSGWPVNVKWEKHEAALLTDKFGDFFTFNSTVGRSISNSWYEKDPAVRKQKISESSVEKESIYGKAEVTETFYSVIYEQPFEHPSVEKGVRTIEIWKGMPKASFKISFSRKSNPDPEIMYVNFKFDPSSGFPVTSNGGMEFKPYLDQIPGTCTDFLAVDGWVKYPAKKGSWIWSSRDAALITFGGNQFGTKSATPPANINELCAMVYNNVWEVNFLNDCIGKMEFKFDIQWSDKDMSATQIADATRTYLLEPVTFINPATREDPHTYKYQNKIE